MRYPLRTFLIFLAVSSLLLAAFYWDWQRQKQPPGPEQKTESVGDRKMRVARERAMKAAERNDELRRAAYDKIGK
jgi:hypothetical protein